MKSRVIDDIFFQGDALLLVEDPLTRSAILKCWELHSAAKKIVARAAGGYKGVQSLVQAAHESGHNNVFGLIDRDFQPAVSTLTGPVFRTEYHEMENHFLDFHVLAKLSKGSSAAQIETIAHDYAKSAQGWMAVRRTLIEMKLDLPPFPSDPSPCDIPDVDAAVSWLVSQPYPQNIAPSFLRKWTKSQLETMVKQYDKEYADDVASYRWSTIFSGKEILKHIRSTVPWRLPIRTDEDLAYQVAERWSRGNSFPPFILELRDTIIAQAGL